MLADLLLSLTYRPRLGFASWPTSRSSWNFIHGGRKNTPTDSASSMLVRHSSHSPVVILSNRRVVSIANPELFNALTEQQIGAGKNALSLRIEDRVNNNQKRVFDLDIAKLLCVVSMLLKCTSSHFLRLPVFNWPQLYTSVIPRLFIKLL